IWRCSTCFDSNVYCRGCICKRHMANPLHHIQCWLGDHFRSAVLWEVGVYFAVPHHSNTEDRGRTTESSAPAGKDLLEPDVQQREQKPDLKRVVHTNGIHYLHIVSCDCQGEAEHLVNLVAFSILPASFKQPKTFFMTQMLDYSRLCNLELKCLYYQFHQLLCRLTHPLAPALVKSLYHEFRRMCRIWRWMKKLKWAGLRLDGKAAKPTSGQFTVFCSACPQPGINIPDNWHEEPDAAVYGRTFVADGNFKADHVEYKGKDAPLYDRHGMMPNSSEYQSYLKQANHAPMRAPCDNSFRTIDKALATQKGCDVTGVVGVACARHGCYCPNALVNLQKGEQQKNVDYAFVKALQHTHVDVRQKVTIIYDIACQYSIHLRACIDELLSAGVPNLWELVIDRAIGLFHVHDHKDECFFRFSPTFIPGLGTVAGEILESLWAALNEISIAVRTSGPAFRMEMLDDHTNDSNHKKILNMPLSLADSFREAIKSMSEHSEIFDEINSRAKDLGYSQKWLADINHAEATRHENPKVMDIYGADPTIVNSNPVPREPPSSPNSPIHLYLDLAFRTEERQ
ncbi:hypothetical protein BJ165DRAFT_1566299, partial [Panaeolus papilionaceus]